MRKYLIVKLIVVLFITGCRGVTSEREGSDRTAENKPMQEITSTEEPSGDYIALFQENSLEGWKGDASYWRMEEGILIGETNENTPPLQHNTFLIWEGQEFGDFDFIVDYQISTAGNSGVNYRSDFVPERAYALRGYQADIDGANHYTGQNYEEMKRTTLAYRGESVLIPNSDQGVSEGNAWKPREVLNQEDGEELKKVMQPGWNELRIIAKGNTLQHFINGELMAQVVDEDSDHYMSKGFLGFQIHTGPAMKVKFRRARVKGL